MTDIKLKVVGSIVNVLLLQEPGCNGRIMSSKNIYSKKVFFSKLTHNPNIEDITTDMR